METQRWIYRVANKGKTLLVSEQIVPKRAGDTREFLYRESIVHHDLSTRPQQSLEISTPQNFLVGNENLMGHSALDSWPLWPFAPENTEVNWFVRFDCYACDTTQNVILKLITYFID